MIQSPDVSPGVAAESDLYEQGHPTSSRLLEAECTRLLCGADLSPVQTRWQEVIIPRMGHGAALQSNKGTSDVIALFIHFHFAIEWIN